MKRYLFLAIFIGLNPFLIKASDSDSKKAGEPQKYESHWDNPLFSSLFYNHDLEALKTYLKAGGKASDKLEPLDQSLLQYAAFFGTPEIFNYLLEHGANPAYRDNDGNTTLMWAAYYNIVQEPLDDFNAEQGEEGISALDQIVQAHDEEATPATQAKVEIINELFKRRLAQVNDRNAKGKTALYVAVETAGTTMQPQLQYPIIATLLKNGAHIDIPDNDGKTILDIIHPPLRSLIKVKLIGLQGQPTFFEAWFKADTKEERGRALIYLLNAIKERIKDHTKQKIAKEHLDNYKEFFHKNRFKISDYARELIAQRIKEIEQ